MTNKEKLEEIKRCVKKLENNIDDIEQVKIENPNKIILGVNYYKFLQDIKTIINK